MIESYDKIFSESLEFMQNLSNKLLGSAECENLIQHFDIATFWVSLNNRVQHISADVTKVSIILSKPPYPTAVELCVLLQPILNAHGEVATLFLSLPKDCGRALRFEILKAVNNLNDATCEFISYLGKSFLRIFSHERLLRLTGTLWEACEDIVKLPFDNKAAVLLIIENEETLVVDALDEIQEIISSEQKNSENIEDNGIIWNNDEFEMVQECVALLKTSRAVCQKLKGTVQNHGKCENGHQVKELDDISISIKKLSPAVDDFISSMYPPCITNEIRLNAVSLSGIMESILNEFKHMDFVPEEDGNWVNFLELATKHNCNKVKPTNNSSDPYSPLLILKNITLK